MNRAKEYEEGREKLGMCPIEYNIRFEQSKRQSIPKRGIGSMAWRQRNFPD